MHLYPHVTTEVWNYTAITELHIFGYLFKLEYSKELNALSGRRTQPWIKLYLSPSMLKLLRAGKF